MQAANPAPIDEQKEVERPDGALIALARLLAQQAAREAFNHAMNTEQAAVPQDNASCPEQAANDNERNRGNG